MAWDASFAALDTGDRKLAVQFNQLKAALQERTGWAGDATQHGNADALADIAPGESTTKDARLKAYVNTGRAIIEAVLGKFYREDAGAAGVWTAWSKATLLQHLYDSHGGEDAGVRNNSGTYNWLKIPTRAGGPTDGNVVDGDTVWHEHIYALYLALDHLRWVVLEAGGAGGSTMMEKAGNSLVSLQAAWNAMLASSPSGYQGFSYADIYSFVNGTPRWYQYVRRITRQSVFKNTPIAGHYPAGWDAAKFQYKIPANDDFGVNTLGPHLIWGNATDELDWTGGTQMKEHTLSAVNTWDVLDLDSPSVLPTSSAEWYLRIHHKNDDQATAWALGHPAYSQFGVTSDSAPTYLGWVLGKPATAYGT